MHIREILDGVKNLAMVVPEFQREYVWSLDSAKQLMVSLYRGYPTGSLLFWQARTEDIPEIKNDAVDREKLGSVQVILDGCGIGTYSHYGQMVIGVRGLCIF